MYYKELKINGVDYPIAVNLTGEGAPTPDLEAEIGMFYMDETNDEVYKLTSEGWKPVVKPITIDSELSETSTNPVQNKVIAAKLDEIKDDIPDAITVDAELYADSANPVQNKVIKAELDKIKGSIPSAITVDDALDVESTNPVQNKVVAKSVNDLSDRINNAQGDADIANQAVDALSERVILLNDAIYGVEEELQMINEGGVE